MYYDFVCKNCGNKEIIEMKITEYTSEGHYCPICNEEMQREISSMKCGAFVDNTNTFYKRYTN